MKKQTNVKWHIAETKTAVLIKSHDCFLCETLLTKKIIFKWTLTRKKNEGAGKFSAIAYILLRDQSVNNPSYQTTIFISKHFLN